MKLFLTVSLMTLVILLMGSLVALTVRDLKMTHDLYTSEQAYYLAEAGLVRGENAYARDKAWRGSYDQVQLGAGTYSVKVYDQGGAVQIASTGVVGSAIVKKVDTF